jgi:hypothetical protein
MSHLSRQEQMLLFFLSFPCFDLQSLFVQSALYTFTSDSHFGNDKVVIDSGVVACRPL